MNISNSKTKAAKGVLATSYAYKPEEHDLGDLVSQLNIDIPEILDSEAAKSTSSNKFRASVILDRENKKILYAIAGTRLGGGASEAKADIKDDIRLAFGLNPTKIKSIREFNTTLLDAIADSTIEKYQLQEAQKYYVDLELRKIDSHEELVGPMESELKEAKIKEAHERFNDLSQYDKQIYVMRRGFNKSELNAVVKEEMKGYEMDFTGHSLGAVLADCAAANMHMQLKSRGVDKDHVHLSSTTFDNPGALTPVKKICKKHKVSMNDLTSAVKYKVFNNRDNFINTLDKQVGEKYQILPDGQKPRSGFANMCAWISKKIPFYISKRVFKYLSFGRLSTQAKDHSLSNFDDVLVEGKGLVKGQNGKVMTMEQATTGIEPLEFDKEVFEFIKSLNTKSAFKEDPQFSMVDPENKDNRIEFSESQLKEVMKSREKQSDTKQFSASIQGTKNTIRRIVGRGKKSGAKYHYSHNYKKRTIEQVISKTNRRTL